MEKSFNIDLKDFRFMIHKKVAKLYICEPYVIYVDAVLGNELILFIRD